MKSILRKLGLGAVALRYFHTPVSRIRESIREGGPFEQKRTQEGMKAMEAAAYNLPELPRAEGPPLSVHLLTGRRFWYQTAFCLWTLAHHSRRQIDPVIYDDGTLTAEFQAPIARLFPSARFIMRADTISRLDEHLPVAQFPHLRDRWLKYPNIRKLTDPHLASYGWKLVLDSDLLFFQRPDFLLDWLDQPAGPLHAVDCETSYGYDRSTMDTLAGSPLSDLVNVGLTGLNSSEIDWLRLEHWIEKLHANEGYSYYLEQALIAMMVAGRKCAVAPAGDYITLPRLPEALDCQATMHHYVAESKRWYFQKNWRKSLSI